MPQFTVYKNNNRKTREQYPYLVDVQADLLEDMNTRVVIPLTSADTLHRPLKTLTPIISVEGESYIALTPQLAGIARSRLGEPVTNVHDQRTELINALDLLISGI